MGILNHQGYQSIDLSQHTVCLSIRLLEKQIAYKSLLWKLLICIRHAYRHNVHRHHKRCVCLHDEGCVWTQLKRPLGGDCQCITLMTVDRLFALAGADIELNDVVLHCGCCGWPAHHRSVAAGFQLSGGGLHVCVRVSVCAQANRLNLLFNNKVWRCRQGFV